MSTETYHCEQCKKQINPYAAVMFMFCGPRCWQRWCADAARLLPARNELERESGRRAGE